jgi:serine/threonine protein kinase
MGLSIWICLVMATVATSAQDASLQDMYNNAASGGLNTVTVNLGSGTWGGKGRNCAGLNVSISLQNDDGSLQRKVIFSGNGADETILDFYDCHAETFMAFTMNGLWGENKEGKTFELVSTHSAMQTYSFPANFRRFPCKEFDGITFQNQRYRNEQDEANVFASGGLGWRGLIRYGHPGSATFGAVKMNFVRCKFYRVDAVYNGPGEWELGHIDISFQSCSFNENGYLMPKKVTQDGSLVLDTYGGLVYLFNYTKSVASFSNSIIKRSCAGYGGVVAAYQTQKDSALQLTFDSCNVTQNMAAQAGGVVHIYVREGSTDVNFLHSTIAGNFIDADSRHPVLSGLGDFDRGGAVIEVLLDADLDVTSYQQSDTHHHTTFEGGNVTSNQGTATTCYIEGQYEHAYPVVAGVGHYPPEYAGQPIYWPDCEEDMKKAIYISGTGIVYHIEGHGIDRENLQYKPHWSLTFKDALVSSNKGLNGAVVAVEGDLGVNSGSVTFDKTYIMSNHATKFGGIAFLLQRYNGTTMSFVNYNPVDKETYLDLKRKYGNAYSAYLPLIPGKQMDGANIAGVAGDAVYVSRWTEKGCDLGGKNQYIKILGVSSGPVVQQVNPDGAYKGKPLEYTHSNYEEEKHMIPGISKNFVFRLFAYRCPANETSAPRDKNDGHVMTYPLDSISGMKIKSIERPRQGGGVCPVFGENGVTLPKVQRNVRSDSQIYNATFQASVIVKNEPKCYFWLSFIQNQAERYAWMEMDLFRGKQPYSPCCGAKERVEGANPGCDKRTVLLQDKVDKGPDDAPLGEVDGKEVPTYTCQRDSFFSRWSTELKIILVMSCCVALMILGAIHYYRYKQRQWSSSFTKLSMFSPQGNLNEPLMGDNEETELTTISSDSTEINRPWEIDFEKLHFTKRIGSGASGEVFSGTYGEEYTSSVGELVAIKQITLRGDPEGLQEDIVAAKKEAKILWDMHHPNIIHFFGLCIIRRNQLEQLFLVTELCTGSLDLYIDKKKPTGRDRNVKGKRDSGTEKKRDSLKRSKVDDTALPELTEELFWHWTRQIAEGMAFMHSKRVVHRDLKPHNIFWNSDSGKVKIGDFGMSRLLKDPLTDTTTYTMTANIGSPSFMAPELLNPMDGRSAYNSAVDVFAYGVILNTLWRKENAYNRDDFNGVLHLLQEVAEGRRPEIPDDCPILLKELMEKCWCQEPRDRLSFPEVLGLLKKIDKANMMKANKKIDRPSRR